MGKIVKTVLKVAAVAAIAYFAPPLAAKVGAKIGIASALGKTALSTGIGALAGEATGVGAGTGAFAGGFAGAGKSGLFGGNPAGASGASGATGGMPSPDQIMSSTNASLAGNTAGIVAPTAAAAGGGGIGGALSSVGQQAGNVLKGGLQNVKAGIGGAAGAVGLGGAAGGGINLGAVAPYLLASSLVGNPGAGMAKAQEAELSRAQQVNAALTQQRLDQANQLIGEAGYFDPEYMGRQAAEDAMIRGGIQTKEQTRGLTGERLAAERRRMALGTSRTAGSAYQQGFGTGVGARVQTRQAGISAIPEAYPITNPQGAIAAGNAADEARAGQIAGLSALFGQAMGQNTAQSRGV